MNNATANEILKTFADECPEWGIVDPYQSHWWMLTCLDETGHVPCFNNCLDPRAKDMMWSFVPDLRTLRVEMTGVRVRGDDFEFLAKLGQCRRCRTVYWLWREAPPDDRTPPADAPGVGECPA